MNTANVKSSDHIDSTTAWLAPDAAMQDRERSARASTCMVPLKGAKNLPSAAGGAAAAALFYSQSIELL